MGAKRSGQVNDRAISRPARPEGPRPVWPGGDRYGTHRVLEPKGVLPQPALRLDNDFNRIFEGELLLEVGTLNIDAASFAQIEEEALGGAGIPPATEGSEKALENAIAHIVVRTVTERGKQHNPVTGSGGMLVGRVLQVGAGRGDSLGPGDRIASLVS